MQELNKIRPETNNLKEDTSLDNFISKPEIQTKDQALSNDTSNSFESGISEVMSPKPDPHFHQATPQIKPAAIQMAPNPVIDQIQEKSTNEENEDSELQLMESSQMIMTMGGGDEDDEKNNPDQPLQVQTKIKVGQPGDKYEREADAVADRVMAMSNQSETIQKESCDDCEEEGIQMKPLAYEISPLVRMQPIEEEEEQVFTKPSGASPQPSKGLHGRLNQSKGGGAPMSSETRDTMESAFGADFGHVRIHSGNSASAMNKDLGARAFTHGSDIYFRDGEFEPGSSKGKRLLSHELTHVLQQRNSKISTLRESKNQISGDQAAVKLSSQNLIQRAVFNVCSVTVNVDFGGISSITDANLENEIESRFITYTSSADASVVWPALAALTPDQKRWVLYGVDLLMDNTTPAHSGLDRTLAVQRIITYAPSARGSFTDSGYTAENEVLRESGWYRIALTSGIQPTRAQAASAVNVVTSLNCAIIANDKLAYMDTLRVENAIYAEDATIYTTIQGHLTTGSISANEAWQAVCILNYGNDSNRPHPWPETIRNFFEGLILGEYSVPGIAPRLKDEILQLAVSNAHTEITSSIGASGGGRGMGPFMNYMGKFNALWGTSTYAGYSSTFNPAMSSKGPKTQRSREIFNHLYATDPQVKSDYDNNVTGVNSGSEGMRELTDQYVGPESRNLVASPRLQRLREAFYTQSLITSNNLTNAAYVNFKSSIQPFAEALNETDRQEIENSHQWRSIIDWTVRGVRLREDLARYLQTAYLSAASPASTNVIIGVGTSIPGTAAISSTGPVALSAPPPALTTDQQTFVDNVTLHATNTSITSNDEVSSMELFGQSTRDEAGLLLRTRVVIDNPALHREGTGDTFLSWPSAATTGDTHRPRVTTGTGRGSTVFNATLTLEHPDGSALMRTGGTTIPPVAVTIVDNRYGAFAANMTDNLFQYYEGGESKWYTWGDVVNYYGGQAPLDVQPFFNIVGSSPFTLPDGLVVYSEAEVTQNGTSIATFSPTEFQPESSSSYLGRVISVGPAAPPTPDAMVVTVNFREASNSGPIFFTRTEPFNINQSIAAAAGTSMPNQLAALSAELTSDKVALNTATTVPPIPASGAGTIIDEMLHHGTPQTARIARTILAGTITLEPMIIRPDSDAFMTAQVASGNNRWGRTSTNYVIFAMGDNPLDIAPSGSPGNNNSLEESPGVAAVQWPEPRFRTTIHVHLTTSLTPVTKETNFASILETIVHEAVHMVDIRPGSGTTIERYKTEFRAYWMEGGDYDLLSTEFDPSRDNFGPKSEKARAIFRDLYNSTTYDFVKPAYDANTNGFRDQVNAYIVPDGINLIVSQKLEDIRSAIAGFGTTYGPAERTRINDLYNGNVGSGIAAADAADIQEISGNRSWRELVESKSFSTSDLIDIKNDLHIPL